MRRYTKLMCDNCGNCSAETFVDKPVNVAMEQLGWVRWRNLDLCYVCSNRLGLIKH